MTTLALAHPLSHSMGNGIQGHFPGVKGWSMKLTTVLYLMPILRKNGVIPLFPHMPS